MTIIIIIPQEIMPVFIRYVIRAFMFRDLMRNQPRFRQ